MYRPAGQSSPISVPNVISPNWAGTTNPFTLVNQNPVAIGTPSASLNTSNDTMAPATPLPGAGNVISATWAKKVTVSPVEYVSLYTQKWSSILGFSINVDCSMTPGGMLKLLSTCTFGVADIFTHEAVTLYIPTTFPRSTLESTVKFHHANVGDVDDGEVNVKLVTFIFEPGAF